MVESWTGSFWRAIGNLPKKLSISAIFYRHFERSDQELGGERVQAMPGNSPGTMFDSQAIEFDLLDKKIRRLVSKLKKYDIHLEVFDHTDIVSYGRMLGKGGEGCVQQCTVLYNGLRVEAAVKTMLDNSDDAVSITLDEIELLCLAKDPIINPALQVYGVAAIPDKKDSEFGRLAIITEAGIMNTLQLYQEETVPLHVTFDLWGQLAAAVHCMHTKKIIHQDLKPENILVTRILRDVTGAIEKIKFKIIDMGMAKRVFTDKIVTDDILGTIGYHAPEVLQEDSYDFRADIFMLGITFSVMMLPAPLLKKTSLQSWLKKIHKSKENKILGKELFKAEIEPHIQESTELPAAIRNMICQMLEKQSRRKISLLEVVELCEENSQRLSSEQEKDAGTGDSGDIRQCASCQDSGVSSGENHSRYSRPRRHRKNTERFQSGEFSTRKGSRRRVESVSSCSSRSQDSEYVPSGHIRLDEWLDCPYRPPNTRSSGVENIDPDLVLPPTRQTKLVSSGGKPTKPRRSGRSISTVLKEASLYLETNNLQLRNKRTRSSTSVMDTSGRKRRRKS